MATFSPVPDDIIELRRDLHLNPELSCKEERTSNIVAKELARLGYRVIIDRAKGYSVLGIMEFSRPGKTLAMRADMDALPIVENQCNLKRKKKWVSKNKGAAHMCGHDFHTAGLLATARYVAEHKDSLRGRVIFCFESGEEIGEGDDARELLAAQGKIDAAFAIHVQANSPVGTVAIMDGPCTAGCATFNIKITGKSVHGATPHLGIDPINCAAQIVVAANSIISRRIDSRESAVLSVCSIHSGTSWNRFPDNAEIVGGLRFFNDDVGIKMREYLEQMVKGTAEANGCTSEVSWGNWSPPTINDKELAAIARKASDASGAKTEIGTPWMVSETFARYRRICPVVLVLVGCANAETGCGAQHHSDMFEADENCLAISASIEANFVTDFLGK